MPMSLPCRKTDVGRVTTTGCNYLLRKITSVGFSAHVGRLRRVLVAHSAACIASHWDANDSCRSDVMKLSPPCLFTEYEGPSQGWEFPAIVTEEASDLWWGSDPGQKKILPTSLRTGLHQEAAKFVPRLFFTYWGQIAPVVSVPLYEGVAKAKIGSTQHTTPLLSRTIRTPGFKIYFFSQIDTLPLCRNLMSMSRDWLLTLPISSTKYWFLNKKPAHLTTAERCNPTN